MRILFCTSQYYPLQLGWAMADYHLSLALARAGHSVFVCTSDTDTLGLQTLQWEGITHNLTSGNTTKEAIEIAPNLFVIGFHIYTEGYLTKGEIVAYRDFVVHFDGDLLFCSGIANAHTLHWACDLFYDLLPTLKVKKILRLEDTPPIWQDHSWKRRFKEIAKICLLRLGKEKNYFRWLKRTLETHLKDFDRVFFLSQDTHAYHTLSPLCSKVGILPHGVLQTYPSKSLQLPLNVPTEPSGDLETLMQTPYLLSVSNYSLHNNHDQILQAYYLSQAQIPLIFVGSYNDSHTLGMLKTRKQELDDQHGFKPVFFLHFLERPQVLDLFAHATLFLHAAPHLCYPLVILESMQYGLPFVCMDIGQVKQLCADLVVQTPQDMAHKIDVLLSDPQYYNQIAQTLHATIQNYTYDQILPPFLETLSADGRSV
ncbi:glycosyltransferase family 4 protein [Helicobacter bizzozeronii]|uniref:glycosyltransferase family 4 protein n=1 Tax=Helicobacter bizzozeronii TaxID=56877 RepID=UPI000CEE5A5B|nr:glycosyltransferase family 4 protein [Helicobacter bizzozeronii]